jgi:hypothetical protein
MAFPDLFNWMTEVEKLVIRITLLVLLLIGAASLIVKAAKDAF